MRQVSSALKAGIEINERAGEIGFVGNWRAVAETRRRPALIVGTSSDRIGTPRGQSYYATVSKSLHHDIRLPVAPYAGISWSTYEDRLIYPFGVNVQLTPRWSAMVLNDGVHSHVSTSVAWRKFSLTLLAVERKDFGFTLGAAF
jgi:hypothetical protein